MARSAKPWFNAQTGWWTVWLNGKRHRLAEGKSARKAAQQAHVDLLYTAKHNPSPEAPEQTVVSVIERWLTVALPSLSDQSRRLRAMYLQSFAEMHGWRLVKDSRPDQLQEWLLKNPQWASDWTKRDAVSAVQIVFNWAKAGLIKTNPFAGFRHRAGLPPRDITESSGDTVPRGTFVERSISSRSPQSSAQDSRAIRFTWTSLGIMSNRMTEAQGEKIFRFASLLGTRRVNLMFDCEATGVEGAKDALWYFAERLLDVRLVWSPGMYGAAYLGKQPESLGQDELKALVR